MQALKLTQIGNSVGLILPKELLGRLKLVKGDTVFVTETPDGVSLRAYDPDFTEQLEAARVIMKKRRSALHELAK
jgi:putative addiction module antidote